MALLGSWHFNENDTANVRDYSTKGLDSVSVSGLTIVSSDRGKAGKFQVVVNGGPTPTKVNFGDVGEPGADKLTIDFKLKFNTIGADEFIIDKNNQFRVELVGASNKIKFSVWIGSVQKTVLSSKVFTAGTFFRLICIYNGSTLEIIVDGTSDATTSSITGNVDSGTDDLLFGHKSDNTNGLQADLEVIEIRDASLTTDEIDALDKNMGGIETTLLTKHNFSEGDLLEWVSDITGLSNSRIVVTLNKDATTILIIIISGRFVPGLRYRRRGNLFDTARQWLAEIKETANKPYIFFTEEVTAFDSDTPDTSSVLDLGGINDRGVLLPSLTTAERDAISSPATSLLFFNETTGELEYFNGTFQKITTPAGADRQIQFNDGGIFGGDANFLFNKSTGNVGIGVSPSSAILDVGGAIRCGINQVPSAGIPSATELYVVGEGAGNIDIAILDNFNFGAGFPLGAGIAFSAGNSITELAGGGKIAGRIVGNFPTAFTDGDLIFETRASDSVTEKMRLDSSGKVGIGVTPLVNLHISGSASQFLRLESTASANVTEISSFNDLGTGDRLLFSLGGSTSTGTNFGISNNNLGIITKQGNGNLVIGTHGTGFLVFGTDNIERMRINSDGVLIDKTLEIDGKLQHDGNKIGFFKVTPVLRAAAYTPTNVTTDRSYDADATSTAELADVLGTLISDLQTYGFLQ